VAVATLRAALAMAVATLRAALAVAAATDRARSKLHFLLKNFSKKILLRDNFKKIQ